MIVIRKQALIIACAIHYMLNLFVSHRFYS